ncbi:hypothetical protein LSH36_934g01008, partial [Paralvinella palmiformis]
SIDQLKGNQEGVNLYTGLQDHKTFVDVLASLSPASYHLKNVYSKPYNIVEKQLFLALMKCRMCKSNAELSRIFKISEIEVYGIF